LPGEAFGSLYPETFDAVLLDAPCSMQGLRTAESHSSRKITLNEIESLSSRQLRMLESAIGCTKTGGQVVYSTCTLSPQEDELVLAALMRHYPGLIQIEDISKQLPFPAPALTEIFGELLPGELKHAVRLWPHIVGTAGFFTARLTKLGRFPAISTGNWRLPPANAYYRPVLQKDKQRLVSFLNDNYGISLDDVLERNMLEVASHKEQQYLIPEKLNKSFPSLPALSAGLLLGKTMKDKFLVSHEFVSRFGDRFLKGVMNLDEEFIKFWMLGEDIRGFHNECMAAGEIYAIRDRSGRNLGRGKLLENRLKNMLPSRLF
jgi:16S rRNA (cytosine1407-C5)-methyltransferase